MAGDIGAGGVGHEAEVERAKNFSMSGAPNSRFMKELLVICPAQPAIPLPCFDFASWKNRCMKGTVSAYVPLQTSLYRFRYSRLRAVSFGVM